MKTLSECKACYKDLYTNCLAYDAFSKNMFDCTELAQFNTLRETLEFIYGAEFGRTERLWQREALNEFYH